MTTLTRRCLQRTFAPGWYRRLRDHARSAEQATELAVGLGAKAEREVSVGTQAKPQFDYQASSDGRAC
jgi:hypothetical protein